MGSNSLHNFNTNTYKKLKKDKSPWYCICCLKKELPYCTIYSDVLKQSEHFDEEILKKVNNKYYTPTEFKNALNELSTKKQYLYMHLNISSFSLRL